MNSDGFLTANQLRRLPIYLLLDCSSSMSGDPITSLNEGVTMMHRELLSDPRALETVYLSIITFASHANQYQLTPLTQFQPPTFTASGATSMGEAFRILATSIEQDLTANVPGQLQHGDYRPLVFLLTDGEPTDNYRDPLQKLKSLGGSRRPLIVALGCGGGVRTSMLHEVTEQVYLMPQVTPERMRAFFMWLSGSIKQTSNAVGSSGATQTMVPPTTVPGIQYSPD